MSPIPASSTVNARLAPWKVLRYGLCKNSFGSGPKPILFIRVINHADVTSSTDDTATDRSTEGLTVDLTDLQTFWTARETSKRKLKQKAETIAFRGVNDEGGVEWADESHETKDGTYSLPIDPNEDEEQYAIFVDELSRGLLESGGREGEGGDDKPSVLLKPSVGDSSDRLQEKQDLITGYDWSEDKGSFGDLELLVVVPLPKPLPQLKWIFHFQRLPHGYQRLSSPHSSSPFLASHPPLKPSPVASRILLPALRAAEGLKNRNAELKDVIWEKDRIIENLREKLVDAGLGGSGRDRVGAKAPVAGSKGALRGRNQVKGAEKDKDHRGGHTVADNETFMGEIEVINGILDELRDPETGKIPLDLPLVPQQRSNAFRGSNSEIGKKRPKKNQADKQIQAKRKFDDRLVPDEQTRRSTQVSSSTGASIGRICQTNLDVDTESNSGKDATSLLDSVERGAKESGARTETTTSGSHSSFEVREKKEKIGVLGGNKPRNDEGQAGNINDTKTASGHLTARIIMPKTSSIPQAAASNASSSIETASATQSANSETESESDSNHRLRKETNRTIATGEVKMAEENEMSSRALTEVCDNEGRKNDNNWNSTETEVDVTRGNRRSSSSSCLSSSQKPATPKKRTQMVRKKGTADTGDGIIGGGKKLGTISGRQKKDNFAINEVGRAIPASSTRRNAAVPATTDTDKVANCTGEEEKKEDDNSSHTTTATYSTGKCTSPDIQAIAKKQKPKKEGVNAEEAQKKEKVPMTGSEKADLKRRQLKRQLLARDDDDYDDDHDGVGAKHRNHRRSINAYDAAAGAFVAGRSVDSKKSDDDGKNAAAFRSAATVVGTAVKRRKRKF